MAVFCSECDLPVHSPTEGYICNECRVGWPRYCELNLINDIEIHFSNHIKSEDPVALIDELLASLQKRRQYLDGIGKNGNA